MSVLGVIFVLLFFVCGQSLYLLMFCENKTTGTPLSIDNLQHMRWFVACKSHGRVGVTQGWGADVIPMGPMGQM